MPAPRLPIGGGHLPERIVVVQLDGVSRQIRMGLAEERELHRRLARYTSVARRVPASSGVRAGGGSQEPGADHVSVSDRLREARVRALLGQRMPEPENELDRLLCRTAEVYGQSLTEETRRTYRRRWNHFVAWCSVHRLQPLPAEAASVMVYLADCLDAPRRPSLATLRGRINAINRMHFEHDLAVPGHDPGLRMLMRGLGGSLSPTRPQVPVKALRIADLRAICRHLQHPDPVAVRDVALLRLRLAGIDVGVLARLRWEDVRWDGQALILGLRRSKAGPVVDWRHLPGGEDAGRDPVRAVLSWRSLAGTDPALVFTVVDRDGHRPSRGLGPSGVQRVLAQRIDSLAPGQGQGEGPVARLYRAARLLGGTASDLLRDRAVLLVGFALAARRGELTELVWDDLSFVDEGLVVRLRRTKTDREGVGTEVGVPWGRSVLTCPVRAVLAWRDRVQEQLSAGFSGVLPVFVAVGRAGRLSPERLTPEAVTRIVRRRMAEAGIPGSWGGRSLRAGMISSAADLDLPLELIAKQSRHASLDSLVRYIRSEDPFRRNALGGLGL